MAADPIFIGTPKSYAARINNVTTVTDIATGVTAGTRIESLMIYNDHSAGAVVNVIINDGTNDRVIRQITATELPTKGSFNVLAALFPASDKQYLILQSGWKLRYQTPTAYANNVDAVAYGGDF